MDSNPPTPADWAYSAAQDAQMAAKAAERKNISLEARVARLEQAVKDMATHIVALKKTQNCCESYPNGPQWGHEWSCPKCPD